MPRPPDQAQQKSLANPKGATTCLAFSKSDGQRESLLEKLEQQHAELMSEIFKLPQLLELVVEKQAESSAAFDRRLKNLFGETYGEQKPEHGGAGGFFGSVAKGGQSLTGNALSPINGLSKPSVSRPIERIDSGATREHTHEGGSLKDLKSLHLSNKWEAHGLSRTTSLCEVEIQHELEEMLQEEEAEQGPLWKKVALSSGLDMFAGLMIFMNAVCLAVELEWKGAKTAGDLSVAKPTSFTDENEQMFMRIEQGFCVIFLLEILLRSSS